MGRLGYTVSDEGESDGELITLTGDVGAYAIGELITSLRLPGPDSPIWEGFTTENARESFFRLVEIKEEGPYLRLDGGASIDVIYVYEGDGLERFFTWVENFDRSARDLMIYSKSHPANYGDYTYKCPSPFFEGFFNFGFGDSYYQTKRSGLTGYLQDVARLNGRSYNFQELLETAKEVQEVHGRIVETKDFDPTSTFMKEKEWIDSFVSMLDELISENDLSASTDQGTEDSQKKG